VVNCALKNGDGGNWTRVYNILHATFYRFSQILLIHLLGKMTIHISWS